MTTAVSIAMCCNVYNDVAAVRGLLETSAPFFDNLFFVHSGPGGARSTDGTIELIEQFGATLVFDDMQRGFGAIRSRLIHDCGCTWAFIMDADERFHPTLPMMHCEGTESFPETAHPDLSTFNQEEICNQGARLRHLIAQPEFMAIMSIRRHWFDFSRKRPTQNWLRIPDNQLRIVRNLPEIEYETGKVMHERLIDTRTGQDPKHSQPTAEGPFHDHYHCFFRNAAPGSKEKNERNYLLMEKGEAMLPTDSERQSQ
jgi:hypothetical protein